jgi:hypothetical protein
VRKSGDEGEGDDEMGAAVWARVCLERQREGLDGAGDTSLRQARGFRRATMCSNRETAEHPRMNDAVDHMNEESFRISSHTLQVEGEGLPALPPAPP